MMNNDDGYLYDGDDRCIMMMHDSRGLTYVTPYTIYCIINLQPGLQKGTWSKDEDDTVKRLVEEEGVLNVKWCTIAAQVRT